MRTWRVALTALWLGAAAPSQMLQAADLTSWQPGAGEWSVRDGALYQADASSPAYRFILAPEPWHEGAIEVDATPLTTNRNGNVGASFGLMIKHVDEGRWYALRCGSYGAVSLRITGDRDEVVKLGALASVPNETHHPKAILRGGLLAVMLDGVVLGIFRDPFAGEAGRPGLFTETECEFDNVRIERTR